MCTVYSAFVSQLTSHSVCYLMWCVFREYKTFHNTWESDQMVDPPISYSLTSDTGPNINWSFHANIQEFHSCLLKMFEEFILVCAFANNAVNKDRCCNLQEVKTVYITPQRSSYLYHKDSDCTRMISTLYFLALLSSTIAWGVRMAGHRSTDSSFSFLWGS